jgi:hypothetical protein
MTSPVPKPSVLLACGLHPGGLGHSYERAFREIGSEVTVFDWAALLRRTSHLYGGRIAGRLLCRLWDRSVSETLIEAARASRPDVVLVLRGEQFSPETLRRVRGHCKALFNFNPDSAFGPDYASRRYRNLRSSIPEYDCHFTWGRPLIPALREAGARRVEWLPFARDPDLHRPVEPTEDDRRRFSSDVAFVGTWSRERQEGLDALDGLDLRVWGNLWERAPRRSFARRRATGVAAISGDWSKVCACAKVVLNLLRPQNADAHNMRTFEIPASGGFQLASRSRDHVELLGDGEGIALFDGAGDLREQVLRWLGDDAGRGRVAARGHELVLPHTYAARAGRILEVYDELE